MVPAVVFLVLMITPKTLGDYDCICCNHDEVELYKMPDKNSEVIGYMYRFDCFPSGAKTNDPKWQAIMFDHQVGYIEMDGLFQTRLCFGTIPAEAKITTLSGASTAKSYKGPQKFTFTTQTSAHENLSTSPSTSTSSPSISTSLVTSPSTSTSTTTATSSTTKTTTQITTATATKPTYVPTTTSTTSTSTTTLKTASVPATTSSSTKSTTTLTTTSASTTTTPTTILKTSVPTTIFTSPSMMPSPIPYDRQYLLSLCPPVNHKGILGTHGNSCYEFVLEWKTFSNAQAYCRRYGGFLFEVNDKDDNDFILKMLHHTTHTGFIWMGLQFKDGHWKWPSGKVMTYQNWAPTSKYHAQSHDCARFMGGNIDIISGQWTNTECGAHGFIFGHSYTEPWICQYTPASAGKLPPTPSLQSVVTIESQKLCPQRSPNQQVTTAVHDNSCYEYHYALATWHAAEKDCASHGGFLFEILNEGDEKFISNMISGTAFIGGVWMGLNDQMREGHWQWISGSAVSYTNWMPGHKALLLHDDEDCAVFRNDGQWDEVMCDQGYYIHDGRVPDRNQHRWICQYR